MIAANESESRFLLVVIPAFNEEAAVAQAVASVRQALPGTPVMVVDDGSLDGTVNVARAAGAEVLELPHHLGLGGAVQAGYRFAFEHGFEHVVRVDADGQHVAAEIPRLLERMRADDVDVVTGSRFLEPNGYKPRFMRRFGSRIFSWVLRPSGSASNFPEGRKPLI